MIEMGIVDAQLREIDALPKFFGRPEVAELPHILFDGEVIKHLVIGRYEGGWATLCATDRRVLLVDKKPFYLTIEDIRYDMVSDVQYDHRLLDATLRLGTVHKTVNFLSYSRQKLRQLTNYTQEQVSLLRTRDGSITSEPATTLPVPARSHQRDFSEDAKVSLRGVSAVMEDARQMRRPVLFGPKNPYRPPLMIRRHISRFY